MNHKKLLGIGLVLLVIVASATPGFSQVAQNRIPQQVIVNGQQVSGAYVTASGGMQTFTCSSPQQYTTPDGTMSGWACYEQATGTWLLNAIPPAPAQVQTPAPAPVPAPAPQVQQQPTVIYQQPPTVIYQQPSVVYAAPVYSYPSYPYGYGYPVVVRRAPVYSSRVVLGAAAINATGRIISAAIGPRYYGGRVTVGRGGHFHR